MPFALRGRGPLSVGVEHQHDHGVEEFAAKLRNALVPYDPARPHHYCRGSGFRGAALCSGVRPALSQQRRASVGIQSRPFLPEDKARWGCSLPDLDSVEVCMHGSEQHVGARRHGNGYALGRADRRWTEDERAQKEAVLRRLVPGFDERGGSVRIGSAPAGRRQRGRWLRIRFQAPLRRDEQAEMISWLEEEDRHIG
jgi:hypothetical protein